MLVDAVELAALKPRDCSEIYNFGRRSDGVYKVYSGRPQRQLQVYCDVSTDSGGWTVCIMQTHFYHISENITSCALC